MDPKSELRSVKAIEDAIAPEDNTITLSTGVVLRGKQVPPLILVKIMSNFPRPKVPTWHSPEMGREVENPDDPDYIDRIKAWKTELSGATLNAIIVLGTELVKTAKGLPGPSDDGWLEEYKLLGVPSFPENKSWRYLNWVMMKAAPEDQDLSRIQEVVGRLSGIPESKVNAAEEFPEGDEKPG